jgi:hypothetical protein
VIDYPTIDLFRNAVIKAAIPGFHVKNWNSTPRGDDRGKGAVGIAKDEHFVGLLILKHSVNLRKYLTGLFPETVRPDPQVNIRRPDAQIAYKYVAEALMVVLACVHGDVIAMLIQHLHYQT